MRAFMFTSIEQLGTFYVRDHHWRIEYRGLAVQAGELVLVTADSTGQHWSTERLEVMATSGAYVQHVRKMNADTERSLLEYVQYVARTGDDPLAYFRIDREWRVKERWYARLRQTPDSRREGLTVEQVWRHGARRRLPEDAPPHVAQFLELRQRGDRWTCGALKIAEVTGCAVVQLEPSLWRASCLIEAVYPRPAAEVRARLRGEARSWLGQH